MEVTAISSNIDLTPLWPQAPVKPKGLVDVLKPQEPSTLIDLLDYSTQVKWALIQWTEEDSGLGYEKYLQFPNPSIQALAYSIVTPSDTNDQKMFKIEQWVQDNITYVSDLENYGAMELWSYPSVTLKKKSGDCEDGAFLMHSLALHGDIPPDRLRTYGGLVRTYDEGSWLGGHAWTAYRREIDDQWIITDWCYWAKDIPISERPAMKDEHRYVDDFFFVEADKTVETPYTNRVRYAQLSKGVFVNKVV
jgi:predicted transglutaminase-like cysteine proteinase